MTIELDKNKITILNLSNNVPLEKFDSLKPRFDIFGCTEFSPKKIILEIDTNNYTHMKMFDFKIFFQDKNLMHFDKDIYEDMFIFTEYTRDNALDMIRDIIYAISNMNNSLEVFLLELRKELHIQDLDGSGYVFFVKPVDEDIYEEEEVLFIELELFKELSSKEFLNLHKLLNSTINIYLETEDNSILIEKWDGFDELWCGGLVTYLPNKDKMTEIFSFDEVS